MDAASSTLVRLAPRIALFGTVGVLLSAAATFAAGSRLTPTPKATPTPKTQLNLVVPDVRRIAFVFAKGSLEDAGFAWRVTGSVHGFAANTVVEQAPSPGLTVVDNGRPTITLRLAKGKAEKGVPQDVSTLRGTRVELAPVSADLTPPAKPTGTMKLPATGSKAAASPGHASCDSGHDPGQACNTGQARDAKPGYTRTLPQQPKQQQRAPAFKAPGARKEPLDEMPLTNRAQLLGRWIAGNPAKNSANVQHWLYQNAWIVTGAKMGWWHGAEALRILIADDLKLDARWGIGSKAADVARAALTEVQAKSR